MQCTNCGNEVPDTAKVCGHCGFKLKVSSSASPSRGNVPGWIWGVGGIILVLCVGAILLVAGVIPLLNNQETISALPATALPQLEVASPSLSPETTQLDSRIVFSSDRDGFGNIYVMDAEGENIEQLTAFSTYPAGSPAWSPNHKQVAFSDIDGIKIIDADGQNMRLIENGLNENGNLSSPSWSPDGKQITFAYQSFADDLTYDIYVMDVDGSHVTRLTEGDTNDFYPVWSPDGQKIAFTRCLSYVNTDTCAIVVMNADGTDITQLTENTLEALGLDWSPDGLHIVFIRCFASSGCGILVMDANGHNMRALIDDQGFLYNPNWSADGRYIAFVQENMIYVMNADGSEKHLITNNGVEPDW